MAAMRPESRSRQQHSNYQNPVPPVSYGPRGFSIPMPPRPPQPISFMQSGKSSSGISHQPPGMVLPAHASGFAPTAMAMPWTHPVAPLLPPPLPPLFPYLSPKLAESLHDGATEFGTSFKDHGKDPEMEIVPVIIGEGDLRKITESVKQQFEETTTRQMNMLLYEDIIDQSLPKELRDMFQPLYCKLCKLTLSSPVVARDHYKGKRHHSSVQLWLQENPGTVRNRGGRSDPHNVMKPIQGRVRPVNQSGYDAFGQQHGGRGGNNQGFKRNADGMHVNPQEMDDVVPAYRARLSAPLGPSTKKPKTNQTSSGSGGQNYCPLCNVLHTSHVTASQHYSGKNHKAKLLAIQAGAITNDSSGSAPAIGLQRDFQSQWNAIQQQLTSNR